MNDADDLRVVIPRDVQSPKADDRGRINIGTEYKDKRVRVAILEVMEEDNTSDQD